MRLIWNSAPGLRILAAMAALLAALAGCTSVSVWPNAPRLELRVPNSLGDAEPMLVTTRLKTTFGPYTARHFRGSNLHWMIPLGDLAFGKDAWRLSFLFSEGSQATVPESEIRCIGQMRRARVGNAELRWRKEGDAPQFACWESSANGAQPWTLMVESMVRDDAGHVTVVATGYRWEVVRSEPVQPMPDDEDVGYLLLADGEAIAAIELAGRGRVWLDPGLGESERYAAAAVAAALLAHEVRRE